MAIRIGGIEFVVRANVAQATQAFTTLGRQGRRMQNNLRQTKTLFGGLGNQISSVRGVLLGLASTLGAIRFTNLIKDSTLLAARVKNLGTVLDNVGRIAGLNTAQIRNIEGAVKRLGITTRAARQSLAQLAQANLDLRDAAKLTRIAQDAAVIAGIDSSEAFNRLVVSIQRNDVRLLRNLGIVINLNSVYKRFSQQVGRTAASLTAFEKRQLLLNEVVERGRLITGTYEASLNDTFKQLTSMRRLVEEASRVFGEQFEPVLAKVVQTSSKFLKAFAEGRAVIGPRFVAVVGSAVVAIGALSVAVGVLAGAMALASAAAGPFTIVLTALAVAAGIGAAAWVNYELQVSEAEERLKTVAEEAENTAQAIVDASGKINQLREIAGKPFGFSVEEAEEVRVLAAELARDFPKLGASILEAGDLGATGAQQILDIFRDELPSALLSSEDALARFEKQRVFAEKEFRKELVATLVAQQGVTEADKVRAANSRFRLGEFAFASQAVQKVQTANARAQRQANAALKDGTAEFIALNPLLVESTKGLKRFGELLIEAASAAQQLRQARLTATFQEFQRGLSELEQGANQAIQILGKLDTERLRLFKNTNVKLLRDFRVAQNQLIAVDIRTREQLEAAAAAFVEAQRADAKRINEQKNKALQRALQQREITQQEFDERSKKVARSLAQTERRVLEQSRRLVEEGAQQQVTILEARRKSIENVTMALEQQEKATRDLLELQQLEIRGIDPTLIRLRRRFQGETRRLTNANIELDQELNKVEQQFTALGATALPGFLRGLTEIPPNIAKNLTGPIGNLVTRLITLNRAFEANRKELLAKEKNFNAQFEREVKRRNEKLIEEQERLNTRLLELQDPVAARLATLTGVQQAVDEIKRGGEEVDDFIRKLGVDLKERATPGIAGITSEFNRFSEAVQNATRPEQLDFLTKQFPAALQRALAAARQELQNLETQLMEFREIEKPKQQRDDRIERQRRFNELVDAGVPAFKARQEVQRIEIEQRRVLEEKEEALQKKIQEQRVRQKQLNEERKTLEVEFQGLIAAQTEELKKQEVLRKKLIELQQQEIALTAKQIEENAKVQRSLAGFARGGVAQRAPTTPRAPEAPAPTGGAGPTTGVGKALGKEADALKQSNVKFLQSVEEGVIQTQRSLRSIREATDKKREAIEREIEQIRAEGQRGGNRLRGLGLKARQST